MTLNLHLCYFYPHHLRRIDACSCYDFFSQLGAPLNWVRTVVGSVDTIFCVAFPDILPVKAYDAPILVPCCRYKLFALQAVQFVANQGGLFRLSQGSFLEQESGILFKVSLCKGWNQFASSSYQKNCQQVWSSSSESESKLQAWKRCNWSWEFRRATSF